MSAPTARVQRYTDGPAIRAARLAIPMSQTRLASLVHASRGTISALEKGEREASVGMLARIADALGTHRGPFVRTAEETGDADDGSAPVALTGAAA